MSTSILQDVIDRCMCGVYLSVNSYRDYYDTIEKAIDEINQRAKEQGAAEPDIGVELAAKLIAAGCVYELQFYNLTPIGSYTVYGASLQDVVDAALEILTKEA